MFYCCYNNSPVSESNTLRNELEEYTKDLPPATQEFDVDSTARWASFVNQCQDLYGQTVDLQDIQGMTANTHDYEKEKARSFQSYIDALASHPKLSRLVDQVEGEDGKPVLRIFRLLGGMKTKTKYDLLNATLIVFSQKLVKKEYQNVDLSQLSEVERAEAQYQPNQVQKVFKQVFRVLRENSVIFQQSDFKGNKGSYEAYWKIQFNKTATVRSDFGRKPNQAMPELDMDTKLRQGNPPLDPFSDYKDHVEITCLRLMRDYALRGSLEVSASSHHAAFDLVNQILTLCCL